MLSNNKDMFLMKIIRWWMTPKLPEEHIFIPPEKRPTKLTEIISVYFIRWVIHPIKRRVAKYYLAFLQNFFGLIIIGITGSAGKTTTKEMLASILRKKGETIASFANIDPIYNIPSTILKCRFSTRYLVLEMGVEYPGEMDFYLWLAKPTVGVITNVYPTHTQYLKSVEGVAKEKGKLVKSLPSFGYAILNSENKFTKQLARETKAKVVWFGGKSTIEASKIQLNGQSSTKYTLTLDTRKLDIQIPILGFQFVENSLAAASAALALGIEPGLIKRGLESFSLPEHRMKVIKLKNGCLVIDDSYNNNPMAAKETLETFAKISGRKKKIIVMGDMLELGNLEAKYHREIGSIIGSMNVSFLIGVGNASKVLIEEACKKLGTGKVKWLEKASEVFPILKPYLLGDNAVLIKGSRSIGLESVVNQAYNY
jgi:UDP-N-acetylmuramoyl-tripeptide--D-alanyl-D-alanine ligase